MANLNFQQPPRSIANASLTGRTTGGFGGSSLSGHVTPTSGMFPTANYGQTQQPQLSPNRNNQLPVGGPALSSATRANLFGQRPFVERRSVPGLGGGGPIAQMGNFMQSAAARTNYGSSGGSLGGGGGPLNNFHNVFGGNGDVSSTPALLDPSEFPSLTNARGQNDQSLPQTNPLQPPGSKPYVGMVKQPTAEQSEFTMSNEDFPALPGTQNSDGTTNPGIPADSNSLVAVTDGTDKAMNSIVVGSGVGGAGSSSLGGGGSGGGIGVGVGGIMGAVGTGVSNMVVTSVASGGPGGNGGGLSPGSMNINVNAATGGVGGLGVTGGGGGGGVGSVVGGIGGLVSAAAAASSASSSVASSSGLINSSGIGSSIATSSPSNTSLVSSSAAASAASAVSSTASIVSSLSSLSLNSAPASGVAAGGALGPTGAGGGGGGGVGAMCVGNGSAVLSSNNGVDHSIENSSNDKLVKAGVQTSPDGKVTNIPASMVNNQFGMVGLLTFIRAAESDPNLVTLALGTDLTGLGLNLNSQGDLHPTFAGPFADQPCRAQDVEFTVPPEYLINFSIRDKLSSPVMKKLQDDLLFFLFYTNIGDIMQLMAAAELHNREWRYHIEEKIWITRIPGLNQYEKNGTKERGTFYYFDAQSWKRLSKVLQIDPEKLDKCPNINAFMNINGQPV